MLFTCALLRRHSVLPGFDLALGFTLLYLSLIVLLPLSAAFLKTFTLTWGAFWEAVAAPRVLASYRLTFGASFAAALLNALFGLVVAWVLVRYEFPFKRVVDFYNPNQVKVVLRQDGRALYFSRSRMPFSRDLGLTIRYPGDISW